MNDINTNDIGKKKKKSKKGWIIFLVLVLILAGAYSGVALYFRDYFLPNTLVNGRDVSQMDVTTVKNGIVSEIDTYILTITGRNQIVDTIDAADINMQMDLGTQVEDALEAQNEWKWPLIMMNGESYNLEKLILYDEDQLTAKIKSMNCMDPKQALAPEDAYMTDFVPGKGFSIVPEVENNKLKKKIFTTMVKECLDILDPDITLEDLEAAEAYKRPKVFQDDEVMNYKMDQLNDICNVTITYKFDDDTVKVTGKEISQWFVFNKKNKGHLDEDQITEFVNTLARKYDSFDGNTGREFKTSYGPTVTIYGGDYGWWMNRGETRDELIKAIKKGKDVTLKPVYYQEAASYSDEDWGRSYVEINLTAQHLYLYVDGSCVLDTPFVSGKPSVKDTPTGVYGITYKERAHTMEGDPSDPYRVETSFWMPFAGNVGMHDATWRSTFGGTIYKSSGSHGCVNLPYYATKTIYNTVEQGFPVIVYKLSGTEGGSTCSHGTREIAQIGIDAIDRIGTVTNDAECRKRVKWARQVYSDLSAAQRAYVDNYSKLTAAEAALN